MRHSLIKTSAVLLMAFLMPTNFYAQDKDSTNLKPSKENWNNFRERDASVFYFTFCVPKSYVTSITATRDSKMLSKVGLYFNFDIAKYELFQILEEELNKETNKKFVVADPDQEDKTFKAYCPACVSANDRYGFDYLPGWMFKKFLIYDKEVPYLVKLEVNIEEKIKMSANIGPEKLKPKCTINLVIYDRDKNTVGKYKYTKKDFDKIRVNSSKNKVFDNLLKTVWDVKGQSGLDIGDVMSIYVQTLEEMMQEVDIKLP